MSDLVRRQDVIDAVQNTVDPSIGIREDGSIFACCDSADVVRKISAISAVEAIPVEWMRKWLKKPVTKQSTENWRKCKNMIEWIILDWKDEVKNE